MSDSDGDTLYWLLIPEYEQQQKHIKWQDPVYIYTNPSDMQFILHQEGIMKHIDLSRYLNNDGDTLSWILIHVYEQR
jgi:hypothetical protein